MQIGLIIVGLIIIFMIWTLIEQKQLVTTKYVVMSEKLPKAFHHTSFVVLSDLHNYIFGKDNERLISQIDKLSPEFILVAGDMINKREVCYPSNAYNLLEQLAKKYKIYYAYGNHEQLMERIIATGMPVGTDNISSTWIEYKEELTKLGITFLDNESIDITKNKQKLRITGASIDRRFFEHGKLPAMKEGYLESLLGKKQQGVFELLISHNPVYLHEYAGWGADLTISGHLHGGLVRLPLIGGLVSPQVWLFPKFSAGKFDEKGKQLIVSRGLGSHSIMPRVFNPPEIVSVILQMKSNVR